jgi:glycosyltransferase involved in cell wall biosynthesis
MGTLPFSSAKDAHINKTAMAYPMKTVAVIPAYNEEKHVGDVVREAKNHVDSVIVVDDGSKDATYEEAERSGAIALRHVVNMGKGFALQTGCEKAVTMGDLIVVLDADGQHDPKEIPGMLKTLEKEGLDMVIGARPTDKNMPAVLKAGNWWIKSMSSALFAIKAKDTQSGFRAFTKGAYDKIKWTSMGYFVETEMLINASKKNLRYREVPIKTIYHDNYKGTTLIDGIRISLNMLEYRIRK